MKDLHKKITAVLFFAVIILIPVISLLFMPREQVVFSEIENRYLARFPRLSLESYHETEFMKGFEDWANDRVIGRTGWIKLRNRTELLLGRTEIDGVFVTRERLMQRWENPDFERVGKTLDAMNTFAERHNEVPIYFMLAPTSLEIYRVTLPPSAPVNSQRDFIKYCYDYLENISTIDVLPLLEELREHYIYYRTDHHWTSLGAYIAYTAAGPVMGFSPLAMNRFNIEHVSNSFLGTLYSLTLNNRITPDVISIFSLTEGDPHENLYHKEFLETKDKYSLFLGPNAPVIEITSNLPERKLLVFKDSYAHSLIPFLAKNYSKITVADMRLININYRELFDVGDYDAVLFMYNVMTFSEDTSLIKINAGGR